MKKIISTFIVVMVLTGGQAFGGMFDSITGGDKKSNATTVDVKALTGREVVLRVRVSKATASLANGLIEIQKATGKAAEAAKLEASLTEAQKNPSDVEKTKQLCLEVNTAGDAIKKIDLNASLNKNEARARLGKSLLHLGAGSMLNMQAISDAKNLVTDITNGISAVKSSPMAYGFSAVKDLTSGLNTAKFVSETIPTQVGIVSEISKSLIKYAKANKIELPTDKEKENLSKEMEKE